MTIDTKESNTANRSHIEIVPRHPHFDATEDLATIWNKDPDEKLALFKTTIMNSLSVLFPEGERFFIRSVKKFEDQVTDPELRKQVKLFIEQEGQHTREHHKYNQALKQRGYDVDKLERRLKTRIKFMSRILDAERQLAGTCAVEHFTAVLGDALLNNPQLIKGASPKMQAIWKWHAVEEIEHKAVAFDVFKSTANNERKRKIAFFITFFFLSLDTFLNMCHMLRKEGRLFDFKLWRTGSRFLFNKKDGVITLIRPKIREYLNKDFHPWNEDNSELVQSWKEAYEDADGNYTPSFSH